MPRYFGKYPQVLIHIKRHISTVISGIKQSCNNHAYNKVNWKAGSESDENHNQDGDDDCGWDCDQDQSPVLCESGEMLLGNVDLERLEDLLADELGFGQADSVKDWVRNMVRKVVG